MLATGLLVLGTMFASAGPQQVKGVAESLSDVLPPNIAIFVDVVGSDRRLGTLTGDELDAVRDPAGHAGAFVSLLCPVSLVALAPPVVLVDAYGEPGTETHLVAGPGVVVDDEVVVGLGETLSVGETLYWGYVLNAGSTTVLVVDGDGNESEIPPGGVLQGRCSYCCSVEGCRAGTHACCYWTEAGCARCTCVKDGKLPAPGVGCDSGGGSGCMMCDKTATVPHAPEEPE